MTTDGRFTLIVALIIVSLLMGGMYDTYKEGQCKMEAFKAGIVSSEIEKICR